MSTPITLAFAGSGEITEENVKALLNDWLGFGEEDADGYPLPSDREINLIFPVTKDHLNGNLSTVLDWSEYADLPFVAVTDDSKTAKVTRVLDDAEESFKVANVPHKVISLLEEADGEAYLVLLWGEEGDEQAEDLLDLADQRGVKAKDLTAALDDLTFAEEDATADPVQEPEPEPEPQPEPESKGRGRRRKESKALEAEEKELTDDPAPEPEPEPALAPAANAVTSSVHPEVQADIDNNFAFHPATEKTGPLHDQVRTQLGETAAALVALVPAGRERALMLTKLQEAMFWANAGIAVKSAPAAKPKFDYGEETLAPIEEKTVEAPQEAAGKRTRGRPRKDGTPAQPRTEEDLKVAFIKNSDGTYVRRGKGRIPRGTEVVHLTPSEIAAKGLDDE